VLFGEERNVKARQDDQRHRNIDAYHHKKRQRCQDDRRRHTAWVPAMHLARIKLACRRRALPHHLVFHHLVNRDRWG
jgi:hypothetical protein